VRLSGTCHLAAVCACLPVVQPFEVRVHPAVLLLTDLHAFMTMHEVIGYLGGRWVPQERLLEICRVFPGKGVQVGAAPVRAHVCAGARAIRGSGSPMCPKLPPHM
jgi:hypothetical protein